MIFITDPYFNEPAYEGMRGTAEGASSSLKYNSGGCLRCAALRCAALRWAALRWAGLGGWERARRCGAAPHPARRAALPCAVPAIGCPALPARLLPAPATLRDPTLLPAPCTPPCAIAEIWLNNIRYAMVDQLRRPRPGFEAATRAHFRLLRWRIMRQCAAWIEQAQALDPLFQVGRGNKAHVRAPHMAPVPSLPACLWGLPCLPTCRCWPLPGCRSG